MGSIFHIEKNREIVIASQNKFITPVKHPSRTINEHIISYVTKGGWVLSVGNELIRAKSDTVFIQPANIPHTGLKNCPAGTHTLFIHFSKVPEDRYISNENYSFDNQHIYINNFIDAKNNPEIKKTLIKTIEEHAKGNHLKASAYLNILLCELSEGSTSDNSNYALAMNIKKTIINDISENLSNKEIAKRMDVGIRTAETTFKDCFGMSIHQFHLKEKIERAKFCLEYYRDMKIIDISLSLGFYDEYHFSRQFKKITGLSPTEYRKNASRQT